MAGKLQIKRGLESGMPPLSEGELGFAVDTGKLYIGGNSGASNVFIGPFDGYAFDSTEQEHFRQTSDAIQTIRKDLDGYVVLTTSQADGYITFFTGTNSVGGDNDLFWDRANNFLGIHNTAPNESLTIGSSNAGGVISLNEVSAVPTNTTNYGKLYVKSSDSKIYFQNDSGIEYDLTSSSGGLTATQANDGYIAFFTGSNSIAGDNDFVWNRIANRLELNGVSITGLNFNTDANPSSLTITCGDGTTNLGRLYLGLPISGAGGGAVITGFNGNLYLQPIGTGTQVLTTNTGTEALPAVVLNSQTGNGWWAPASNTQAFSTNGLEVFRMDSSQRVGIGDTNPNEKLTVGGYVSLKEQGSSPSDSSGYGKLFVKSSNSSLYFRTDSGVEYNLIDSGLNQTVTEHYYQHSEAIQSIRKDLDGYAVLTATQSDGYIAFFTGSSSIAGDNDLYWDRANNFLGIHNTSPNESLTLGSSNAGGVISLNEVSAVPSNTTDYGKLYVKASDSKLYFQNDSGVEYDLTAAAGVSGSGANGRVAFWTSASAIGSDSIFFWDDSNNRLGIGTGSPQKDLHLSSSVDVRIRVETSSGSASDYAGYEIFHSGNFRGGMFFNSTDADLTIWGPAPSATKAIYIKPTTSNVGIGVSPNEKFTVEGVTSLRETTAPSATTNYGKVYVKSSDSKLYFMNDSGTEYDLTAAAGLTFTQAFDGYVAFFTGSNSIAGDNDLFFDRINNNLIINHHIQLPLDAQDGYVLTSDATGVGNWQDPALVFERLVVNLDGTLVLDAEGNPTYTT